MGSFAIKIPIAKRTYLEQFPHLEFIDILHQMGKSGHFLSTVRGNNGFGDMVENLIQRLDSSIIDH